MSDTENSYCRLCAEPTAKTEMVSPEDDAGINSKIATKMLWINIDISTSSTLPNMICFSCFDLLERTWMFLHNVRTAQAKLNEIFQKESNSATSREVKCAAVPDAGKPINRDWEEFQVTKYEVKFEQTDNVEVISVDPTSLINLNLNTPIKSERPSYDDNDTVVYTTDSDMPLLVTLKKKKKKKKCNLDSKSVNMIPFPVLTWDDYMCRCATCDAQCKNMTSLRLHSMEIHSSCCIFKCSECCKVIANFKTFVNHVRLHKKLLRYCCEFCNRRFSKSSYMKKHQSANHKNAYLTTCQSCGAGFENEEQLQEHIVLYTKGLKRRFLKREEINELKCECCQKKFKSRSNLQQHKLVHTERSRDFSCHVCGKMFFTKGTLSTHMQIHEDTKPFKCEFCPMAFRARGNLQSHISLHSGAKPFVCEQCGKSFRVKRHLKSHAIVHTDLMPYVCEYCNKSFRFKTRLNLHLRQHTGAKPYNCIYCQRDFTNGSNFKKHMKRRHNIDTSKKRYNNIIGHETMDGSDDVASQA